MDGQQDYARRLDTAGGWKGFLDVQRPYRWNLKRLELGRTLDIGCGIGRNLINLPAGSVGLDFNEHAIARARERGCDACTPEEFFSRQEEPFDSILVSHVLEHLTLDESRNIFATHLPHLKDGGRVVAICPQEKGFARKDTRPEVAAKGEAHITFLDAPGLGSLLEEAGLEVEKAYSFPFPRPVGKVFRYNETVVVGRKPAA